MGVMGLMELMYIMQKMDLPCVHQFVMGFWGG